jgi:hypothetical protein
MSERSRWEVWTSQLIAPVLRSSSSFDSPLASLEAFARTLCGVAPWCEREGWNGTAPTDKVVGQLEAFLTDTGTIHSLFDDNLTPQVLVEAAFISQAIIRSPNVIAGSLSTHALDKLVIALKHTRRVKPGFNNWILFSAMVECALRRLGCRDWDCVRIDYALRQFEQWYAGNGFYCDGPSFAFDYYNSFVIHPMLVDVVRCFSKERLVEAHEENILARATVMAGHLEAMISPEGTFPVVGRSLAYRFGILHALAQAALLDLLPPHIKPSAARAAISSVISRFFDSDDLFDDQGLLNIGFISDQPEVGESYISQGSSYFCTTAFLPLGLPKTHPFWSEPDAPWSAKSAWAGFVIKKRYAPESTLSRFSNHAFTPAAQKGGA